MLPGLPADPDNQTVMFHDVAYAIAVRIAESKLEDGQTFQDACELPQDHKVYRDWRQNIQKRWGSKKQIELANIVKQNSSPMVVPAPQSKDDAPQEAEQKDGAAPLDGPPAKPAEGDL